MKALRLLFRKFTKSNPRQKEIIKTVRSLAGYEPDNVRLFDLAFLHKSQSITHDNGYRESNERLEFLGDAILGAVVADFLYKKFPFKSEGFLTEIRSRIVNRDTLNNIAFKMGMKEILNWSGSRNGKIPQSLGGDALEAFIGAVYLDKGYGFTKSFITNRLLHAHIDLEEILRTNINHKSKLIEWAQKNDKELKFEVISVKSLKKHKEFSATVFIDNDPKGKGAGQSKKKAEQEAAQKTLKMLNL